MKRKITPVRSCKPSRKWQFISSIVRRVVLRRQREKHILEIFTFLNVSPIITREQQKRILPSKLSDKVGNYDEIRKALTDTIFEKYLLDIRTSEK